MKKDEYVHEIPYRIDGVESITVCPHVVKNRPQADLPKVGDNPCQACLFHEGHDNGLQTVTCSCSEVELDPAAIDSQLSARIDLGEGSESMERLVELFKDIKSHRATHVQPQQGSDARGIEGLMEILCTLQEIAGVPIRELSDVEVLEMSTSMAKGILPQMQEHMQYMGRLYGPEALKKHELQVYSLLEEKIAARRLELE